MLQRNFGIFGKRRKLIAALTVVALGVITIVYAIWIEPYSIEVTHNHLAAPFAKPLKIAHLTDLHTEGLGRREREMLSIIDREQPDLIVITGDTMANEGTYEMCQEVLKLLHAPLGVWLVRGNWENWRPAENDGKLYESVGVRFLINSNAQARDDLWIVGFDDVMSGKPDLESAFAGIPPGAFKIALFHSPVYFESVAGKCNLALSGHTHGGQVRIPFVPPLWLPPGCGRFVAGWYEKDGSRMYVSRGLGTSIFSARLFCRPELAFITVGP
jgi:uncharacterized protein